MAKKIDMQKATLKTWHRKNRSRIRITRPNGEEIILEFKTHAQLDAFADTVLDLLDSLDDDPYDETE